MNHIVAIVSSITIIQELHLVELRYKNDTLFMMSLELHTKVQEGVKVKLLVKPMHIALAKSFQGELSFANQLNTTISSIENGTLLASVVLEYSQTPLEAIITQKSADLMGLQAQDKVLALIKASDISIAEILDD